MHYIKTEAGKDAMKSHSNVLSPKQRSGLIMINGERRIEDILKMVAGIGFTMADVSHLEELGLIAALSGSAPSNAAANSSLNASVATNLAEVKSVEPLGGFVDIDAAQARYRLAYPLATKLTAGMGLRGFRLNLAVEAAGSYSQLVQLFPKIQEATGAEKAKALENALRGIE
jgi:hypothetical protein